MTTITITAQLAAAKRELAMRRRVYPRWIAQQRMSEATAHHEIACMQAIVDTLEALAPEQPKQGALL